MVKKTIHVLRGSPYKGHSDTSESRAGSTSKLDSKHSLASTAKRPHDLGSSNSSAIPAGAHKLSDDFYSYDKGLYITGKAMSYLADKLDEGGLPAYNTGFSYKSTKAVDLSTLGRGGLWDKLHEGEVPAPTAAPGQTGTLAYNQSELAKNVLYWLANDDNGNIKTYGGPEPPTDKGLTAGTSKTWWENYGKGENDSGSGKGDFALSTLYDWLFTPAKSSEVGVTPKPVRDQRHDGWYGHRHRDWFYMSADNGDKL